MKVEMKFLITSYSTIPKVQAVTACTQKHLTDNDVSVDIQFF